MIREHENNIPNTMIKEVDNKLLESLPGHVRDQITAKPKLRYLEKEIVTILEEAADLVTLDYILAMLYTRFKIEVKRFTLNATISRLVQEEKIQNLPGIGKKRAYKLNTGRNRPATSEKRQSPDKGSTQKRTKKDV